MAAALQQELPYTNPEGDWHHQVNQLNTQQIYGDERLHWMVQLREKLFGEAAEQPGGQLPLDDTELVESMLALAERLCDWSIVIYLRNNRQDNREEFNNLIQLSWAYYRQGWLNEASESLRNTMLRHYQQQNVAQDYYCLQNEISDLKYDLKDLSSGYLRLIPMAQHHFQSFCWAYDDPKIGELCNLPDFQSAEQWYDWFERNDKDPERTVFALNHSEWGMIGSVCLEMVGDIGFFYYWLGADFQGQGFGTQALSLLLDVGSQYHDMKCCYAKVFTDNIPSQKVMEKVGFVQLPFKAAAPDDNEYFYYIGPERTELQLFTELQTLFSLRGAEHRLTGAPLLHL